MLQLNVYIFFLFCFGVDDDDGYVFRQSVLGIRHSTFAIWIRIRRQREWKNSSRFKWQQFLIPILRVEKHHKCVSRRALLQPAQRRNERKKYEYEIWIVVYLHFQLILFRRHFRLTGAEWLTGISLSDWTLITTQFQCVSSYFIDSIWSSRNRLMFLSISLTNLNKIDFPRMICRWMWA